MLVVAAEPLMKNAIEHNRYNMTEPVVLNFIRFIPLWLNIFDGVVEHLLFWIADFEF
jgi:hypothetical protein